MAHIPIAPPGIRFFGRVDRFHCECPACGHLIMADKEGTHTHIAPRRRQRTQYNPITARVSCPSCRRTFGVGLLLWSLKGGSKHAIPADQIPTTEQARQMAQYGAVARWPAEVRRQGEALNRVIDSGCTCPQLEGGWRPTCPVHGWEAMRQTHPELFGLGDLPERGSLTELSEDEADPEADPEEGE